MRESCEDKVDRVSLLRAKIDRAVEIRNTFLKARQPTPTFPQFALFPVELRLVIVSIDLASRARTLLCASAPRNIFRTGKQLTPRSPTSGTRLRKANAPTNRLHRRSYSLLQTSRYRFGICSHRPHILRSHSSRTRSRRIQIHLEPWCPPSFTRMPRITQPLHQLTRSTLVFETPINFNTDTLYIKDFNDRDEGILHFTFSEFLKCDATKEIRRLAMGKYFLCNMLIGESGRLPVKYTMFCLFLHKLDEAIVVFDDT
ncbi:hypothetical protein BDZ45DRAFT_196531 [Acephala macrosclerotiorum]|nr:hypothetical protein BDZ45DRAFT_196531 [Acephala macrosclerotiorum]